MARVNLYIPISDAVRWDIDELVGEFDEAAALLGGELVDDSETEDPWEWFEFSGLSPLQVRDIIVRVIGKRKATREIKIGGDDVRVVPR